MNNVLKFIEEDKKYIEEFPLETTEGTKKVIRDYHIKAVNSLNEYINGKIKEYEGIKKASYEELKRRVEEEIPKDSTSEYIHLNEQIITYKRLMNYSNKTNTVYEKLDFDKIYSNIGDIDISNLTKVNSLINKVINIFRKANIEISAEDFDYTMYTKEYMKVYFKCIDQENFKDEILKVFNQIYWECPELTIHLGLSIRNLYKKYEKELTTYCESIRDGIYEETDSTYETFLEKYNQLTSELAQRERRDKYLLSKPFFEGTLMVNDYLETSSNREKTFNRFLIEKSFNDLNEEEKIKYFERIRNLKYVVIELTNYNKYKALLSDIRTRYNKKDNYKNIYQTKLKELEKAEKERVNLYNQYYSNNEKKFLFFSKKVDHDMIKVKMNECIKNIYTLTKELEDAQINLIISEKLNDASTIADALKICASYYSYFKSLYPKIESNQDDFNYNQEFLDLNDFIYESDKAFIRKINFLDETDIVDIIVNKYKLLNINISKDDLSTNIDDLIKSIDYINLIHDISNTDLSFSSIKTIIDFSKLEN